MLHLETQCCSFLVRKVLGFPQENLQILLDTSAHIFQVVEKLFKVCNFFYLNFSSIFYIPCALWVFLDEFGFELLCHLEEIICLSVYFCQQGILCAFIKNFKHGTLCMFLSGLELFLKLWVELLGMKILQSWEMKVLVIGRSLVRFRVVQITDTVLDSL